jgi:hypothetical protein
MSDETKDANAAAATRCCERDHDGDGNCDVHQAPGVLRRRKMRLTDIESKCPYCEFTSGIDAVMKGHILRAHVIEAALLWPSHD